MQHARQLQRSRSVSIPRRWVDQVLVEPQLIPMAALSDFPKNCAGPAAFFTVNAEFS